MGVKPGLLGPPQNSPGFLPPPAGDQVVCHLTVVRPHLDLCSLLGKPLPPRFFLGCTRHGAARGRRPAWSPYVSGCGSLSSTTLCPGCPVSASATSWPWITTLQAKGFSDHSPAGQSFLLGSRGLQPLAQSAQAVLPASLGQGTWWWKAPLPTPFSSVLFPGSLSSWQQLVQWPCCDTGEIFPPCVLVFIFFPLVSIPAQDPGGFFSAGLSEASWCLKSYGSPAATTIARVVLGAFCHIVPIGFTAFVLFRFHTKCVIPGLFGYMCSVITKL